MLRSLSADNAQMLIDFLDEVRYILPPLVITKPLTETYVDAFG